MEVFIFELLHREKTQTQSINEAICELVEVQEEGVDVWAGQMGSHSDENMEKLSKHGLPWTDDSSSSSS